ncbi:MAG: 4Fe-4S dicluster domain-containing protein [Oscillospiraceae bacterium]|nr:4Fe-4S dicluster domain-containing protein [Oscillospiraceae bacterium]
MKLLYQFDPAKCTGCGACAVACMDQNDIDVEAGQESYRRVYEKSVNGFPQAISTACRHCDNAPCIPACPMGCLYKDPDTGLTRYDNQACIGCKQCLRACPWDAVTFRPTGLNRPKVRMEKCHGCLERIQADLIPACVRACPTGALTWRWVETDAE